ncbi:MAG: hypothetical protein V3S29_07035 [bacterium]
MEAGRRTFHDLLRTSRTEADQSPEVMAVLLNMTTEDYEALEAWKYPDEETLKRLCLMSEWNYYDTQRLIINEMISPHRAAPKESEGEQPAPAPDGGSPRGREKTRVPPGGMSTLGDRLREVRLVTGQSIDIIALLLNIDSEAYTRLEGGEPPTNEVLRRISVTYNWNYQDLVSILRSQHAKSFQPARVGMPFLGATAETGRLRRIVHELEALFGQVPQADRKMVLAQLELVRDSMRRHSKHS